MCTAHSELQTWKQAACRAAAPPLQAVESPRRQQRQLLAGVDDGLAAGQAVGGIHGNAAHGVVTNVLRHLQHQPDLVAGHLQRRQDGRQLALKVHVHHGTDDLRAAAG